MGIKLTVSLLVIFMCSTMHAGENRFKQYEISTDTVGRVLETYDDGFKAGAEFAEEQFSRDNLSDKCLYIYWFRRIKYPDRIEYIDDEYSTGFRTGFHKTYEKEIFLTRISTVFTTNLMMIAVIFLMSSFIA